MPANELADNSENLARYNELKGKANRLLGQYFKIMDEIIPKLDEAVRDMESWQGVRANRFREEWGKTRESLEGWAGEISAAYHKVNDEAENYKV